MNYIKKLTTLFIIFTMFNIICLSQIIKTSSSSLVGYSRFVATAYCLKGKTASGAYVRNGIIAVDPRVIKLGSSIQILGLGNFIALDTGGAIKGNRIDIWMPCSNAKRFGRKTIFIKKI